MNDSVKARAPTSSHIGLARKLAGLAVVAALGGATAGATFAHAQTTDARQACRADYDSFCAGVQPGGGRIIACLKKNADKLSAGCQRALAGAKAGG